MMILQDESTRVILTPLQCQAKLLIQQSAQGAEATLPHNHMHKQVLLIELPSAESCLLQIINAVPCRLQPHCS